MSKPRILVVEDEDALAVLLRYNLDAAGYQVTTTDRGDEADLLVRESVPDLVLLDWMLPGMSGIELCRRLRQRPETQRLPIILLTARGAEDERVRGLATGADDYIVKPFSVPELLARIGALLRRAAPWRPPACPADAQTCAARSSAPRASLPARPAGREPRACPGRPAA